MGFSSKNFITLGLVFTKLGGVLLKVLKSAKVLKFGLLAGSVAAYSYLYTWEFALGIILGLFIHEYGHVWAMKKTGMSVKGMYFIPFLGAVAVSDEQFSTRKQEILVALAGPAFGFAVTIIFLVLALIFNTDLLYGLTAFTAFINLFNLFPINPLDGGRATKSIAFSIGGKMGLLITGGGLGLGLILSYFFSLHLLTFIIVIGLIDLVSDYKTRDSGNFETMKIRDIVISIVAYVGIILAFIGIIYLLNHIAPSTEIVKNFLHG